MDVKEVDFKDYLGEIMLIKTIDNMIVEGNCVDADDETITIMLANPFEFSETITLNRNEIFLIDLKSKFV